LRFAIQQLNFTKGHQEINDRALNKSYGNISKLEVHFTQRIHNSNQMTSGINITYNSRVKKGYNRLVSRTS